MHYFRFAAIRINTELQFHKKCNICIFRKCRATCFVVFSFRINVVLHILNMISNYSFSFYLRYFFFGIFWTTRDWALRKSFQALGALKYGGRENNKYTLIYCAPLYFAFFSRDKLLSIKCTCKCTRTWKLSQLHIIYFNYFKKCLSARLNDFFNWIEFSVFQK